MFEFLHRDKERPATPKLEEEAERPALPAATDRLASSSAASTRPPSAETWAHAEEEIPNVIGLGTRIEGPLEAQGDVLLRGQVRGSVTVEGRLIVESEGSIHGDVVANTLCVRGSIEGEMIVASRLEIGSSGRIVGNVNSRVVTIDEGGALLGRCSMRSSGSRRASASTSRGSADPFVQQMLQDDDSELVLEAE